MQVEVKGWTLADQTDEAAYRDVQAAASVELRDFALPDGSVAFEVAALLVRAEKPQ